MNPITTIEELIDIFERNTSHEYPQIMKQIDIPNDELDAFATWNSKSYTRNCLCRNSTHELILLCWDVGVASSIHGHAGKDCWVYQLQGTVDEVRYKREGKNLRETNKATLSPGGLTYMHDRMGYHRIANNSTERAMTLHIYASPIVSCEVYDEERNEFETKEMSYDSFKGQDLEVPTS